MWLAVLLAGCQGDPLLAAGIVAMPMELADLDVAEPDGAGEPVEREDGFRGPSVPVEGDGPGVGGGVKETANAAADGPPAGFQPISVPQGPREGGGVKWEGVTGRGQKYVPLPEPNEWKVVGAPDNPVHPSLR